MSDIKRRPKSFNDDQPQFETRKWEDRSKTDDYKVSQSEKLGVDTYFKRGRLTTADEKILDRRQKSSGSKFKNDRFGEGSGRDNRERSFSGGRSFDRKPSFKSDRFGEDSGRDNRERSFSGGRSFDRKPSFKSDRFGEDSGRDNRERSFSGGRSFDRKPSFKSDRFGEDSGRDNRERSFSGGRSFDRKPSFKSDRFGEDSGRDNRERSFSRPFDRNSNGRGKFNNKRKSFDGGKGFSQFSTTFWERKFPDCQQAIIEAKEDLTKTASAILIANEKLEANLQKIKNLADASLSSNHEYNDLLKDSSDLIKQIFENSYFEDLVGQRLNKIKEILESINESKSNNSFEKAKFGNKGLKNFSKNKFGTSRLKGPSSKGFSQKKVDSLIHNNGE